MCKEGIRIGRRTAVRSTAVDTLSGTIARVLTPNASRIGVIIVAGADLFVLAGETVRVMGGLTQNQLVYDQLTQFDATTRMSVETHGQIVTGQICVHNNTGQNGTVFVTELYLTEGLGDL